MKILESLYEMARYAWAFWNDPEARQLSDHTYPSGAAMSVREARRRGLIHDRMG